MPGVVDDLLPKECPCIGLSSVILADHPVNYEWEILHTAPESSNPSWESHVWLISSTWFPYRKGRTSFIVMDIIVRTEGLATGCGPELSKRTESRRWFAEDGVESWRSKKTELAMKRSSAEGTEVWTMKQKLTPLTLPYAHVVLICSCDSSILMRVFYAKARGLWGRSESRGRSGEDGGDPETT